LSKALIKKEKEKLAQVKKEKENSPIVTKEINSGVKKRCMRSSKISVATKDGSPYMLSKRQRTFVTPFASQGLSNSLEVAVVITIRKPRFLLRSTKNVPRFP